MVKKVLFGRGSVIGMFGVFFLFLSLVFSGCTGCASCNDSDDGKKDPADTNHAPVVTSSPGLNAVVGTPYQYQMTATDADGDTLVITIEVCPAGMTMDIADLITWTPQNSQVGDHQVTVKVSDGKKSVLQTFTITVTALPNHAPVITSTPITSAVAGSPYIYTVTATDADADILVFSPEIFPSGMTINGATGTINWTPTNGQVGDHTVKVKVSDGIASVYQQYTLTVTLPGPNLAPIITSWPIQNAFAGIQFIYSMTATDPDGDLLNYTLLESPSGMSITPVGGVMTWTPAITAVGNFWVTVQVSDGETSDYQQFSIRVSPSNNGIPFMRGCVLTSWWYTDYESLKVEETLLQMREDGCDTVLVLITWYQDTLTSTVIYRRSQKTPRDAGVAHVTNYAHSLGMDVYFKPHVDVIENDAWRGYITFTNESDWTAWFASYQSFITYYLDMAETLGVEGFIIGTELVGTEHRETNWRSNVTLGRSRFSGLISYGANHDSYAAVTWWDAVDFIGISGYFPLTISYTPTVAQINNAWLGWIGDLSGFATAKSRDIVFLEIGYQSRNGTNISPWWAPTTTVDLQEQADCYQAAFESLFDECWFKGMAWWMWYWDPIQNVDAFDVYTKPAELELRYWYAGTD